MSAANTTRSFDWPSEFLSNIVPLVRNLQLTYLLVLTATAVTLNLLVMGVTWKNRKSRNYKGMAINVTIAALDILWALLVHPIAFSAIVSKSWPHGEVFCKVTGSLTMSIVVLRNQLVGLTQLDRFCSVFAPFRYFLYRRKVKSALVGAAVTFALVYGILPAVVPKAGKYTFYPAYTACFLAVSCADSACYVFITMIMAHWAVCCAILPTLLFAIMYVKARMVRRHPVMGTFNAVATIPEVTLTVAPTPGNESLAIIDSTARHNSCASYQTTSPRESVRSSVHDHRPTVSSTKRNVAATFTLHIAIYVGCLLPLGVNFVTYRAGLTSAGMEMAQTELVTMIGFLCGDIHLLLTVLDPIMVLKQM